MLLEDRSEEYALSLLNGKSKYQKPPSMNHNTAANGNAVEEKNKQSTSSVFDMITESKKNLNQFGQGEQQQCEIRKVNPPAIINKQVQNCLL